LFGNSKIIVFVIEDDQHYSPARIAGLAFDKPPDAESVEQTLMLLAFSERLKCFPSTRRFSLGYNVSRRWQLNPSFQTASQVK
jgi:hypothetical protein